jgi:UDP-N-acetyl-D-glucosamine dehydrogenase
MPAFVREKAMRCLNSVGVAASRSRILVLGVAYKKDVGDYRESPSLKIIHLLKNDGAEVGFYDPYTHEVNEGDLHLIGEPELTPAALAKFDLTIIATNHSNIDYDLVVEHSRLVLDTRNATKKIKAHREKITLL